MTEQRATYEKFIDFLVEWYGEGGFEGHVKITKKEAIKYTDMYMDLFPNLWSGGDSLDREKVMQLLNMGRGDTLAKKHKGVE